MLSFDNTQLDPPKNWQDFEVLCKYIWAKVWKDENTKMHGRSGQSQQGIDIYGRINGDGDWCGVQCKLKDSRYDFELTPEELLAEVTKAKTFTPQLKHYTIATTAKSDAKIQKIAREISEQHKTLGLFSVHVESWDDICQRLRHYPELIDILYPEKGLSFKEIHDNSVETVDTLNRMEGTLNKIAESIVSKNGQKDPIISCSAVSKEEDYDLDNLVIEREIDSYKDLIQFSPRSAIKSYQKLKEKYWNSISNNMRFRIMTNIGASHLELGEYDDASEYLIKAKDFSSQNNVKALRNSAYGYLLKEDFVTAKNIISEALEIDENDPENYVIYIAALAALGENIKFEEQVPAKYVDHAEIIFAIGNAYYKSGDKDKSFEYIKKAYQIDNNSIQFGAAYGALLLDDAISDGSLTLGSYIEKNKIPQVIQAKEILTSVWDKIKNSESVRKNIWVALNLCIATYVIKDKNALEMLIHKLTSLECQDVSFYRISALHELRNNNFDKVLSYLNQVPEGQSLELDVFRIQVYAELGQFELALKKIDSIQCRQDSIYVSDLRILRINLIREISGIEPALEEAKKIVDKFPDDPLSIAALASLYAASNEIKLAKDTAIVASQNVIKDFDPHGSVVVADILYDLNLFVEAQNIYSLLLRNYQDSHVLRRYLLCLYQNDSRYELVSLFDMIDEDTLKKDFYLFHMGAVQVKVGDYKKALVYLSEYLTLRPNDLAIRLNWIYLKRLLKLDEDVREFLSLDEKFFSANVNEKIQYAFILAQYGYTERGRTLLYDLLRLNQGELDANFGYIQYMLMFRIDKPKESIEVGKDSAVTIEYDHGKKSVFIIESEKLDKVYPEELIVTNPLCKIFLQKKIGDMVEYPLNEFNIRRGKIIQIEDKYSYTCRKMMETVDEAFPGNKLFGTIELRKEGDNFDFSPLLKMVEKKYDVSQSIVNIYKDQLVPLSFIAHMLGENPFEVWNTFSLDPDVGIKCFGGSYEDIKDAKNSLQNNFIGLMVDPLSLYFVYYLGIQDLIVKQFGKLGVTQSTLDLYRLYIEKYKSDKSTGSLRKNGDKFILLDYTQNDLLSYITIYDEILKWALDNCVLIHAVTSQKPKEDLDKIKDKLGDAFYDTLLAASGSGRLLLSDDFAFRTIAKYTLGIDSIWTQIVILQILSSNIIKLRTYAELIGKIAWTNIKHAMLDSSTLLQVVKNNQWKLTDEVLKVFSVLGDKDANILLSLIISLRFSAVVLNYGEPLFVTRKFIYLVINKLIENNSESAEEIIGAFFDFINYFPTNIRQDCKELLVGWCIGHFFYRLRD